MTLDPAVVRLIHAIKDPETRWSDEELTAHGRELFSRQLRLNPPYATFCARRSVTPESLTHWSQIPAVPTDAFKVARLTCCPQEATPTRTFLTSGTTAAYAGAHHMGQDGVAAYTASLLAPFRTHLLAGLTSPPPFLLLAPAVLDAPHSSLSFMLDALLLACGHPTKSRHFVTTDATTGLLTLDTSALSRALTEAAAQPDPVVILGTAFAFAALFEDTDTCLTLPAGSRLMETGGFKGRTTRLIALLCLKPLAPAWVSPRLIASASTA